MILICQKGEKKRKKYVKCELNIKHYFERLNSKKKTNTIPPKEIHVNIFNSFTNTFLFFTARKRSCGKVMFLHVSVILLTGGACMVEGGVHGCGGCAWLWRAYMVVGGMHGCRGHVWLWGGGMYGCGGAWLQGACVVAGGGMHTCGRVCMVAGGGHA